MSAAHVIKPVKLPVALCAQLNREARRQRRSASALVAAAVLRDLSGKNRRAQEPGRAVPQ